MTDIVKSQENDKFPLSEGIMVKNCIKYGSKLYCYNKAEGIVYVYPEQIYRLKDCPDYVIADLIAGKQNAFIIANERPLSNEEIEAFTKAVQGEN